MQLGMTARNFSLLRKHRGEVRKFCLFVKSFSRVLMYAHSSPCRASNTACKHLFVDHMHGVHLKPFQLFFMLKISNDLNIVRKCYMYTVL